MLATLTSRLQADLLRACRHAFLNVFAGSALVPRELRALLYRGAGIYVGPRANVYPGVHLETNRLRLGRRVMINRGTWIDNVALVTIGDNVSVGHAAMFCTTSHELGDAGVRAGSVAIAPINVGTGSWIGARAVILPGVDIGTGCVIAAGAIVTRSTSPNTLYAGAPARPIRELPFE